MTHQALRPAATVTALAGDGTFAGYHLMQDTGTGCGDMDPIHGTMAPFMDRVDPDAKHAGMAVEHRECRARMDGPQAPRDTTTPAEPVQE